MAEWIQNFVMIRNDNICMRNENIWKYKWKRTNFHLLSSSLTHRLIFSPEIDNEKISTKTRRTSLYEKDSHMPIKRVRKNWFIFKLCHIPDYYVYTYKVPPYHIVNNFLHKLWQKWNSMLHTPSRKFSKFNFIFPFFPHTFRSGLHIIEKNSNQ